MTCSYTKQLCEIDSTLFNIPRTGDMMDGTFGGANDTKTKGNGTAAVTTKKPTDSTAVVAGSILAAVSMIGGIGVLVIYFRKTRGLDNDDDDDESQHGGSVHGANRFHRLDTAESYGGNVYASSESSSDDDDDDDSEIPDVGKRSRLDTATMSDESAKNVQFNLEDNEIYVPREVYKKVKKYQRVDSSTTTSSKEASQAAC